MEYQDQRSKGVRVAISGRGYGRTKELVKQIAKARGEGYEVRIMRKDGLEKLTKEDNHVSKRLGRAK